MTKSKLWVSLAAGAALAVALSSAALATDLPDANADQDPGTPHAANVTLPDKASSIAKAVLAALTAGTNPSTVASKGKDNAAKTDNDADETNDVDTDESADTDTDNSPTGSTGAKPGWGCGDDTHKHNGPPGRPGATMPPTCTSR